MPNQIWKSDPKNMTVDPKYGPYVHWWEKKEKEFLPFGLQDSLRDVQFNSRGTAKSHARNSVGNGMYNNGAAVPLPKEFANPNALHDEWEFGQVEGRLPAEGDISEDTIVTGILDTGIAINQMMSNIAPQRTRIVASWQQGAPFGQRHDEPWLPCGGEVFSNEIDDALKTFGDEKGVVDEIAFNRHLNLSSPEYLFGNRDLEMAFAHGTHTLNLAAGLDPSTSSEEDRIRNRIIAVNLPAQYSHGSGGNFLAYFAVYGVERILFLADALWQKRNLDPKKKGMVGFPIVINFSYGMVAGPKDGHGTFEEAFYKIIQERKQRLRKEFGVEASPVRILMPAGNDNLERGAASSLLGAKDAAHHLNFSKAPSIDLPWQIKPNDSTANFLEIWSEAKSESVFDETFVDFSNGDFKVFVSPPGEEELQLGALVHGTYQDLGDYARVYCRHVANPEPEPEECELQRTCAPQENRYRLGLLVCVAPTISDQELAPVAPAGTWNVRVEYTGDPAIDFEFYIQSDQSAVVTSKTGLRSYFDHENYRTHMTEHKLQFETSNPIRHMVEDGRVADTFAFVTAGSIINRTGSVVDIANKQIDNDYWLEFGPVQRRGMANALASRSMEEIIAVGGYDDSNGGTASYSSSTSGNVIKQDENANEGRRDISICFPSENAPSLYGLLSAGSRDGSVVASRGTSMATGLATRTAAKAFDDARGGELLSVANESWFREKAEEFEEDQKYDHLDQECDWVPFGTWGYLKMGAGRMPDPLATQKLSRLK